MSKELLIPGVLVRELLNESVYPTFDILFINEAGICRYSNDVFNTKEEAISLAKKCTKSLVESESWDFYTHVDNYTDSWKLVERVN